MTMGPFRMMRLLLLAALLTSSSCDGEEQAGYSWARCTCGWYVEFDDERDRRKIVAAHKARCR
jgi:hypothetical protein